MTGTGAYEAVVFDLDGVICFTDVYHYRGWKSVADDLGIPFDETVNNRLRGVSRMASLEIVLERYEGEPLSDARKEELAATKNERYRQMLGGMSPADLDPSVRTTLDELRGRGLKLAIGSSSKNAKFILERIGLGDYFDAVSDGTNITRSKPDPEVFLKAAEFLGVEPGRCVVVEDAVAGIEAGAAAGMYTVAIGDAAQQGVGDARLERFADLLDVMSRLGS
ncbi:MAG TPA: beta-phosphoglucomutase [Propionibacteriaceae bacterium]|nr:beta-phosphoglucomutase [Propionibacteriaceae bacterium]